MSYTILPQMLGQGSFGEVFLGINQDKNRIVAIKREIRKGKSDLKTEHDLLITVKQRMPKALAFWKDPEYRYLATELMGPSLGALHKLCNRKFSVKTSLMTLYQMLQCLSALHSAGILHRDIKPDNFVVDYSLPHKNIYIIDLGLSKRYIRDGRHIPYNVDIPRIGTLRYMSKNVHNTIEPSRRDDLYSTIYTVIYLCKGYLPWGLKTDAKFKALPKRDRYSYIANLKQISNEKLVADISCKECGTRTCLMQKLLIYLLDSTDKLGFTDAIDYHRLLTMVDNCIKEHGYKNDYMWDWTSHFTQ